MSSSQAKADCLDKENKFIRMTRKWDPNNYDTKAVIDHRKEWIGQISDALDSLTDAVDSLRLVYGTEIENNELRTFKDKVSFGEAALTNIVNQYSRKSGSVKLNVTVHITLEC